MGETGISNLQQRIAVALVGIPLILWLNWMGREYFFVLVLLLTLLATSEFHRLLSVRTFPPALPWFLFFSLVLQLNFFLQVVDAWLLILFILMVLLVLELFRTAGSRIVSIGSSMTALLYVNVTFGSMLLLRKMEPMGASYVLLMFVCIWAADILAYFGGSRFGGRLFKRKLFERLSPHKTWEGFIAGCVGSVFGSAAVAYFDPGLHSGFALLAGLFTGLLSPLGDLVESMFKRDAEVKDSSSLIPGHGGILDRFDTAMFISPLLYLYAFFTESLNGL
ncbi:MAG: phosphatidate cytidylyltransferase [Chlorobiales bacterium]|nr:phosphatidate cytidylyltransferase [Chlorobiales bacterium]